MLVKLTQSRLAAFHFDASVKTSSPLLDCRVNHSLVKFIPCRQCTHATRQRLWSDVARPFLASPTTLCSPLDSSPDCCGRNEVWSLGFQ